MKGKNIVAYKFTSKEHIYRFLNGIRVKYNPIIYGNIDFVKSISDIMPVYVICYNDNHKSYRITDIIDEKGIEVINQ